MTPEEQAALTLLDKLRPDTAPHYTKISSTTGQSMLLAPRRKALRDCIGCSLDNRPGRGCVGYNGDCTPLFLVVEPTVSAVEQYFASVVVAELEGID